jgi:hypothetical protein
LCIIGWKNASGGKMQAVEKSQGLEASQASPFSKKASDAAKIVHQIIDRAISPLCDSGFLAANRRFYNSFENLRKLASHTNTSEAFKSFLIEKNGLNESEYNAEGVCVLDDFLEPFKDMEKYFARTITQNLTKDFNEQKYLSKFLKDCTNSDGTFNQYFTFELVKELKILFDDKHSKIKSSKSEILLNDKYLPDGGCMLKILFDDKYLSSENFKEDKKIQEYFDKSVSSFARRSKKYLEEIEKARASLSDSIENIFQSLKTEETYKEIFSSVFVDGAESDLKESIKGSLGKNYRTLLDEVKYLADLF